MLHSWLQKRGVGDTMTAERLASAFGQAGYPPHSWVAELEAGLDEGLLLLFLPRSCLYGE